MDIINQLKIIFKLDDISVSERVKVLESHFNIEKAQLPTIDDIYSFFSLIPKRDKWKITFLSPNDESIIVSNTEEDYFDKNYISFCEQLYEDDIVEISILVNKNIVENVFSIYCFNSFSEDLVSKKIEELMAAFSFLLKQLDYIVFYLYDANMNFSTTTMTFISDNNIIINKNHLRIKRIKDCKDTSYFYNAINYELVPEDFNIEIDYEGNPFTNIFKRISMLLSLAYISSNSSIEGDFFKGQIIGQRNFEFNYKLSGVNKNDEFYKIYSWIYTDGNPVDKAIIARNIISLHCKYTDLLNIDGKTYSSIQSNYNLYLKDNVSQYLELKNKLADFICDVLSKIGDHATIILDNFKSNLIAIFVFLFSVILVNIVSEKPLTNIFTKDITAIIEIILIGSVIYLIICVIETKYKLNKTKNSYNSLKDNYKSILSEMDIKEAFGSDKLLHDIESDVNKGMKLYARLWGTFLGFAFLIVESISEQPIIVPFIKKILSFFIS